MKALTVWQPWASLIAHGFKPYEFRSWAAPDSMVGQRIAIHAGARKVRRDEVQDLILRLRQPNMGWTVALKPEALPWLEGVLVAPDSLPRSAVVCTAVLGAPVLGESVAGEFGGAVNDSQRYEHSNYAWPMGDVQMLDFPAPATGKQGFWHWNPR